MAHPEIAEITAHDQPFTEEILSTLHRMAHQVDEMHATLAAWRPVIDAWQRGGVLGARTAAKRMRQV